MDDNCQMPGPMQMLEAKVESLKRANKRLQRANKDLADALRYAWGYLSAIEELSANKEMADTTGYINDVLLSSDVVLSGEEAQ